MKLPQDHPIGQPTTGLWDIQGRVPDLSGRIGKGNRQQAPGNVIGSPAPHAHGQDATPPDANGRRLRTHNSRDLAHPTIFLAAPLFSYVSCVMSLESGDLITTATPLSCGVGRQTQARFLATRR